MSADERVEALEREVARLRGVCDEWASKYEGWRDACLKAEAERDALLASGVVAQPATVEVAEWDGSCKSCAEAHPAHGCADINCAHNCQDEIDGEHANRLHAILAEHEAAS